MMIEGAHPLHQLLYAAMAYGTHMLNLMVQKNYAELEAQFSSWITVPAVIRAD